MFTDPNLTPGEISGLTAEASPASGDFVAIVDISSGHLKKATLSDVGTVVTSGVLLADGSTSLTAAWDAGSYGITAETFTSDIATGTAPLTVSSTTKVTNLNADKLDGADLNDSGTGSTDIWSASKTISYLQNAIDLRDPKDSVRAASTANVTLATDVENGDTIDGVTLATGDRILLKNQTTGSENGIYTVAASGAPSRTSDLDTGDSAAGATIPIEEGTTNADTIWFCTSNAGSDVVGTDSLAFSQIGSDGAGITTLNGETAASQTFAKADDTNVTLAIASAAGTHTFTIGWSGTLAHERGGLEADVSAFDGLLRITGGATSAVTVTAFALTLLDDATATAARGTLGLTESAAAIVARVAAASNITLIGSSSWDISVAAYASKSLSVGSQESTPQALAFSSDGTKAYVLGNAADTIYQYTLSTAWDISTGSYASKSLSVASQETEARGLAFSSDGTKAYVAGYLNDTIYQYTLSTAWDISTGSYASKSLSVTSEDGQPESLAFSSDGTKAYILGSLTHSIYQYTLSTAWDISTGSYASKSFAHSSQSTNGTDVAFKSDGTAAYLLENASKTIYQYTLSTAWDISTASYASKSFSAIGQESYAVTGLAFRSDGTAAYVVGTGNDTVYQYRLTGSAADPSPVDGVTLANSDVILLTGQTDASQNGVYDCATATDPATWTRSAELAAGAAGSGRIVKVTAGTAYANSIWTCTTLPGSDVVDTNNLTFTAPAAGGLTNWTEANATPIANEITSLTPASVSTNVDVALVPNGTGAVLGNIPDGTASGGNDRGLYAVDLQLYRTTNSRVASGDKSALIGGEQSSATGEGSAVLAGNSNQATGSRATVIGGWSNQATNSYSAVVNGNNNQATGLRAVVVGGNNSTASGTRSVVVGGEYNLAGGESSVAHGSRATTRNILFAIAHGAGQFTTTGDAQCEGFAVRVQTTDATQTPLTANASAAGTTNIPVLPNNHAYGFTAKVTGRDSSGNVARYRIEGLIKRGANAAATSLVWSSVSTDYEDVAGWAVDAAADTTNGGLLIRVTGAAATTINWVGRIETEEVG